MKSTKNDVMTPEHLRWPAFKRRLARMIKTRGCDAVSLRHAQRILGDMGGIKVAGSLRFFKRYHGFCDCEIIGNVARQWRRGTPTE